MGVNTTLTGGWF